MKDRLSMSAKPWGVGVIAALAAWTGADAQGPPAAGPTVLSSPAFADYGALPLKYAPNAAVMTTFDAVSPPLAWTRPPPRTVAFAVTMIDLEAAQGGDPQDEALWMVVNIPANTNALVEGIPKGRTSMLPEGAFQRSALSSGYIGPQPGASTHPHHYVFELYTLDKMLDLPRDVTLSQLKAAVKGHETGERRVLIAICCAGSR
jgi:Raf kinase inhibitor-like YbhB/YbcL family protein